MVDPPSSAAERLFRLFHELCEDDIETRQERLAQLRSSSPELATELEGLLRADALEESPIDGPITPKVPAPDLQTGDRIADFEICGLIAEGGMGRVYEARQSQPERRVALKIHRGALASELARRFQREAAILATLRHPNIAQVYRAGVEDTRVGRLAYFAMELVEGGDLARDPRVAGLSLSQRIKLIAETADAVQHAHQRGVIHRDLKPSNVLLDDEGSPKVVDFGVARLDDDLSDPSMTRTLAGQLIGTVHYMSPEQTTGDPDAVDTRCDVYALGILAYRLLSGRLPFEFPKDNIAALVMIREATPIPLERDDRRLRGDLATVVHQAMHRDKEQRYPTASGFAADLRRVLAHEPIEARAPSGVYRFRRLVQRHRIASGVVALGLLALVVSLALALGALRQSRDAETKAIASLEQETRAARVYRKVHELLLDALSGLNPFANRKQGATVDGLANAIAEHLDREDAFEPAEEIELRRLIGAIQAQRNRTEAAQHQFDRCDELLAGIPYPLSNELGARVAVDRGESLLIERKFKEAKFALARTQFAGDIRTRIRANLALLRIACELDDSDDADFASSDLATLFKDRDDFGFEQVRWRILRAQRAREAGRVSEALKDLALADELASGTVLPLHTRLHLRRSVAETEEQAGAYDQALDAHLSYRNMLLDAGVSRSSSDVVILDVHSAWLNELAGREDKAEEQLRSMLTEVLAISDPSPLQRRNAQEITTALGGFLGRQGRSDEALGLYREPESETLSEESQDEFLAKTNRLASRALSHLRQEEFEEAAKLTRELLPIYDRVSGRASVGYWSAYATLARIASFEGRHDEALASFRSCFDLINRTKKPAASAALRVLSFQVNAMRAAGDSGSEDDWALASAWINRLDLKVPQRLRRTAASIRFDIGAHFLEVAGFETAELHFLAALEGLISAPNGSPLGKHPVVKALRRLYVHKDWPQPDRLAALEARLQEIEKKQNP